MTSVVVLNGLGQYWGEAPIRRVLKWISKKKITILAQKEDEEIRGVHFRIKVPLVVQLTGFAGFKVRSDKIPFSPKAVFERDGNICQYWHYDENGKPYKHKCDLGDRTIDHVIPKVQGGIHSFENCVTCCTWHNSKVKKGRTPKEAGIKLIREPFTPYRKRGEVVIRLNFNYNPENISHRYYVEKILGKPLTA